MIGPKQDEFTCCQAIYSSYGGTSSGSKFVSTGIWGGGGATFEKRTKDTHWWNMYFYLTWPLLFVSGHIKIQYTLAVNIHVTSGAQILF